MYQEPFHVIPFQMAFVASPGIQWQRARAQRHPPVTERGCPAFPLAVVLHSLSLTHTLTLSLSLSYLSTCRSVCLFFCLLYGCTFYLSIYLTICLSICLSICLCLSLSPQSLSLPLSLLSLCLRPSVLYTESFAYVCSRTCTHAHLHADTQESVLAQMHLPTGSLGKIFKGHPVIVTMEAPEACSPVEGLQACMEVADLRA